MGISYYYAVRILRRKFHNLRKTKKVRRRIFGLSAVWTRLELALRACISRDHILTTPPNLPLIGEAKGGRSFASNSYNKKGDTCVSPFCGMDETRTRDPLRDRQVF